MINNRTELKIVSGHKKIEEKKNEIAKFLKINNFLKIMLDLREIHKFSFLTRNQMIGTIKLSMRGRKWPLDYLMGMM